MINNEHIEHLPLLDARSDTQRASQLTAGFEDVAFVFDVSWHGIRSATSCLPGGKIGISHKTVFSSSQVERTLKYISDRKINHLIYQGFSRSALDLAERLRRELGPSIRQYVVSHVSSAMFGNAFEMEMISEMVRGLKTRLFTAIGSVKPRFGTTVPEFWQETLVNIPPTLGARHFVKDNSAVFIPVTANWWKNLHTNVLAANRADRVERIYVIAWPGGIEFLNAGRKVRLIPFGTPLQTLTRMGSVSSVVHSTLVECQPMTQLESLATYTPCITSKLGVHPKVDTHPLTKLSEVDYPDDVGGISAAIDEISRLQSHSPAVLRDMITDLISVRSEIGLESYRRFLD